MGQLNIFGGVSGGQEYKASKRINKPIKVSMDAISDNFFFLNPEDAVELLKDGKLSEEAILGHLGITIKDTEVNDVADLPEPIALTEEDYARLDEKDDKRRNN